MASMVLKTNMTHIPEMSRKSPTSAENQSPQEETERVSVCCSYAIAHISDTQEDKIFCLNCGVAVRNQTY